MTKIASTMILRKGQFVGWKVYIDGKKYPKKPQVMYAGILEYQALRLAFKEAGLDPDTVKDIINSEIDIPDRKCRVCGCTDLKPCPGGCAWVNENLCSACATDEEIRAQKSMVEVRNAKGNINGGDRMKLPTGKTAKTCHHFPRCSKLFGCCEENTECDFSPSRYREAVVNQGPNFWLKPLIVPVNTNTLQAMAVHGALCLALRHPLFGGEGDHEHSRSRQLVVGFTKSLGEWLVHAGALPPEQLADAQQLEAEEGSQDLQEEITPEDG